MEEIVSFGEWVQARRNQLRYTRKGFAELVGCAPITIKKIERDERRPSIEIAELLATHLQIPDNKREDFIQRARGKYVARLSSPVEMSLAEAQTPADEKDAPSHNLPAQTTPFFGRKKELGDIAANLADPNCRLLTILGAGGMGKTRLGIQAAAVQYEFLTDGAVYVALAPVSAEKSDRLVNPIAAALADALGIAFHGGAPPEQQLFDYLRRKEMLLVFDNFEHLLETADFLTELLIQAPDIKILVTSRERLNLQEEWLFALQGLPFIPGKAVLGEGADEDAVQLFIQRARQVKPSFNVDIELPGILQICRLVEGMPLGLELAAVWVFQLSCREIAAEIEAEIGFLNTQMRNVPERHRSIQSVFTYSWEKLTPEERDALGKLSVFRAGFERNAAHSVAGASLSTLASLTGKSLLSISDNGRYHVHELLRQFAADQLDGLAGLERETQAQHAQYFLGFLRRLSPRLIGPEGLAALATMYQDLENIRVAVRWTGRHQPEWFDREIADSLVKLFSQKGWYLEGETTFGRIAESLMPGCARQNSSENPGIPQICLNLAIYLDKLGKCQFWLGRIEAYEETAEKIIELVPETRDPATQAVRGLGFVSLGGVRYIKGDYPSALKLWRTALDLLERAGDTAALAENYLYYLNVFLFTGDYDEAERCLETAMQLSSQLKEPFFSRSRWNEKGKLATIRGQLVEAEDYFRESVAQLEEIEDQRLIAFVWRERGDVARLRGNFDIAREYIQRSIALGKDHNMPYPATQSLWSLGNLAVDEGEFVAALDYFEAYKRASPLSQEHIGGPGWALLGLGRYEEAKRYFLTSLKRMVTNQVRPIGLDALVGMAHIKARSGQFEEAIKLLTVVTNHPSTQYESKRKASKLWKKLTAELPAELVAEAETHGRGLDLTQTAEAMLAE